MRPQARPFLVETKSRNRARQPAISASFARQDDWLDLVPPDELPERDVNEYLGVTPAHEAFREAERVFARIGRGAQAAQVGDGPSAPVTVAEPARRVLPDLLAAAREEEQASVRLPKPKRATTRTTTTRRPSKSDHQPVSFSVLTVEMARSAPPNEFPTGHAEAAIALSRRKPARSKIPAGQRWKERRLPKVCWDRKRHSSRTATGSCSRTTSSSTTTTRALPMPSSR
jgi:hypothetical protein